MLSWLLICHPSWPAPQNTEHRGHLEMRAGPPLVSRSGRLPVAKRGGGVCMSIVRDPWPAPTIQTDRELDANRFTTETNSDVIKQLNRWRDASEFSIQKSKTKQLSVMHLNLIVFVFDSILPWPYIQTVHSLRKNSFLGFRGLKYIIPTKIKIQHFAKRWPKMEILKLNINP